MHFSKLLPCVLIPFAAAAPAETIPVAPLVTLYHDSDWTGQQFDVRSLKTCVKVVGPLLCALFESDDCRPGTEVIFIKAGNSKVNIRHNDNVRSVYCLAMTFGIGYTGSRLFCLKTVDLDYSVRDTIPPLTAKIYSSQVPLPLSFREAVHKVALIKLGVYQAVSKIQY
ncbi:hypothetical protein TRIATDRAFT_87823 [Trichoderma atroviride IMI 206040]|uniref:Uncharacterized protein n=1 Tax=Hypocrea atroviridis (strain ATCC 20476 / IMI 206040) TaxID=452589 RepID=G9NWC6_HYPAI|nr:uncharacterized protein TRIATDRAFT_87823 [Trichoderma atroviride IMI 206040]EHK45286.1 hypothetical protein TRIATDRAFT_87823 [Trichoderma atroviride IMI 206040]